MKTYLGELNDDEVLPHRFIKLGVVGQVLASMSNVSHYILNFMEEDLSLALLFEDGERVGFTTAGFETGLHGMDEEALRNSVEQARMEAHFNLLPTLRQAAKQGENGEPSREHRFYAGLSVFIAGGLPNLVQMEGGEAPFSTVAFTFSLNGKKITRVVELQEIPEDQSDWPKLFVHIQRCLVKKAVALAGGDN